MDVSLAGQRQEDSERVPISVTDGSKGGKKDKAKDQRQKATKHDQEAKRMLDKQPKKIA